MTMEKHLYFAILVYFLLGAAAFARIARKKDKAAKRAIWIKYFTYLFIIHAFFVSIYFGPHFFTYLGIVIVLAGLVELLYTSYAYRQSKPLKFLAISLIVYMFLAWGFIRFTTLDKGTLYFAFFVVTVFDAFSQISGQLAGGRKLWPSISPKKTISGLVGGGILACTTGMILSDVVGVPVLYALFFALIIVIFALAGDLLASFYKRCHGVKDFSRLIPGHGGFLDRFDSIIPGGAVMYLLNSLL